jgi:hypothetical protein
LLLLSQQLALPSRPLACCVSWSVFLFFFSLSFAVPPAFRHRLPSQNNVTVQWQSQSTQATQVVKLIHIPEEAVLGDVEAAFAHCMMYGQLLHTAVTVAVQA